MSNKPELDCRQRRSKAAFREAFSQMMCEMPIDKITVKAIAARANRDRKTFYLHYDSIDDLWDELIREEAERFFDEIAQNSVNEQGQFDVKLLYEAFNKIALRRFNEKSEILRHANPTKFIAHLQPIMTEQLIRQDSFGLAKSLGSYLPLFVSYFSSGMIALFISWQESDSDMTLEELAALAAATTTGGITALAQAALSLQPGKHSESKENSCPTS